MDGLRAICAAVALATLGAPRFARVDAGPDVGAHLASARIEGVAGDALVARLVGLGDEAAEPLFSLRVTAEVPAEWDPDATGFALHAPERAAVRSALEALPLGALRTVFERLAAQPTRETTYLAAALETLGARGQTVDVELCVDLASPGVEEQGVPRARRVAFEGAVGSIAARENGALFALKGAFDDLHPSLLAPAVRCIASEPAVESLSLLAGMLERVPGIDGLILTEIASMGRVVPHPVAGSVLLQVRYLLTAEDPNEVILAVQALAALEDYDSIPRFLDMMAAGTPRVAEAARQAMAQFAGRDYREHHRLWVAWYEAEHAWWLESDASLRAIHAADPVVALAALRDVSGHRLHRHRLAAAVAEALSREEPELCMLACSILRSLRSSAALPALERALDHADEQVGRAVRETISVIRLEVDAPAEGAGTTG